MTEANEFITTMLTVAFAVAMLMSTRNFGELKLAPRRCAARRDRFPPS